MSAELSKAKEAAKFQGWSSASAWALIAIAQALEERNEAQSVKIDTTTVESGNNYYGVGGYGVQDR